MAKPYSYQPAGTVTVTTTGNIDNLETSDCAVILMNNASLATIRGLKAGYPGQTVSIISIGAGQVNLEHQNAGSTAANRLVNFVTSFTTPLAAGVGKATYQYDDVTARWRLRMHEQGAFITIPHAGGNFTADSGATWTVDSADQVTFAYFLDGRRCDVKVQIDASSVAGGPPTTLIIALPMTPAVSTWRPFRAMDVGTGTVGMFRVVGTLAQLICYRDSATTAWTAGANATNVNGDISFELS